jgi:hypothetical protein
MTVRGGPAGQALAKAFFGMFFGVCGRMLPSSRRTTFLSVSLTVEYEAIAEEVFRLPPGHTRGRAAGSSIPHPLVLVAADGAGESAFAAM